MSKVTRTHANGFLIGDIVFGEGSHDPVKWERVLFPQRKLKAVKRTIKNSLSERGTPAQSVKGAWKANPPTSERAALSLLRQPSLAFAQIP